MHQYSRDSVGERTITARTRMAMDSAAITTNRADTNPLLPPARAEPLMGAYSLRSMAACPGEEKKKGGVQDGQTPFPLLLNSLLPLCNALNTLKYHTELISHSWALCTARSRASFFLETFFFAAAAASAGLGTGTSFSSKINSMWQGEDM